MSIQRWFQSFLANKLPWNLNTCAATNLVSNNQTQSFLDSLKEDGFVWNTPKKRKSIYRQYRKRYGVFFSPKGEVRQWGSTPLHFSNRRIRADHKTLEFFELGKLAPKTYAKVMEETEVIRKRIADTFGEFAPHNKEVKIVYKDEANSLPEDKGRMPIEMEKPRPSFFSKNLMQKTKTPSEAGSSTTVRPSGLS